MAQVPGNINLTLMCEESVLTQTECQDLGGVNTGNLSWTTDEITIDTSITCTWGADQFRPVNVTLKIYEGATLVFNDTRDTQAGSTSIDRL
jgi:hypothetical protein